MKKIKKRSIEDRFFPITTIPQLSQHTKLIENSEVTKRIIQGAIQGAFQLKTPSSYDLKYGKLPKTLVSQDQVELVAHLNINITYNHVGSGPALMQTMIPKD